MTNVGQKIGYGDEILSDFLLILHGNVGISDVDKGPHSAEPTALGAYRGSEESPPPSTQNIKICCEYFWIGFRSPGRRQFSER
jgi:hypothetical protein